MAIGAHTPGPWKARSDRTFFWVEARDEERDRNRIVAEDIDERDVALIAAAPELLAACEVMMAQFGGVGCEAVNLARAAISKAKERR